MKYHPHKFILTAIVLAALVVPNALVAQVPASCYKSLLSGSPPTPSVWVQSINSNGTVTVNGDDTAQPTMPFQIAWGEGSTTTGFFPQQHVYAITSQNYVVVITATDNNGTTQQFSFPVFFIAPQITQQTFPGISFQIPSQSPAFQTHWAGSTPPTTVAAFGNGSFPIFSSTDVAYILSAASSIDYDFANKNSFLSNGVFQIDMLENTGTNPDAGDSFWYTTPMSVGYAPSVLVGPGFPPINWYVLFNEIGKDTTLNTPTSLTFGGNTDGNASEIYSETMGDIFTYAAGCQMISNASSYGMSNDATLDIQNAMLSGAALLQGTYNQYVAAGAPFSSWSPGGGTDPTIGTFSTLAWKFIEHAEIQGQGYQIPTQRMMQFLQMFDSSMLASYAPTSNTQAGATFRSTLMVAALSFAFSQDLRSEFEALNFPIDDTTFEQLYQAASGGALLPTVTVTPSSPSITTTQPLAVAVTVSGGTGNPTPTGTVTLTSGSYTSAAATLTSGSATINVAAGSLSTGSDTLTASYTPDASSSLIYTSASGTAPVTVTQAQTQTNYAEHVLYTFTGGSDGGQPDAGLISDAKGNLYGTTADGGNISACPSAVVGSAGCGVVFELSPPNTGSGPWTETVLYSFTGGSDGAYPYAGLIFDQAGNLFGTALSGGGSSAACGTFGCGVVFELSPPSGGTWTEKVLYRFQGGSDGDNPQAGLVFDKAGNLLGTTQYGGVNNATCSSLGCGTVFELSPNSTGGWTETIPYKFQGTADGASPTAALILDQTGSFYGTTGWGSSPNANCAGKCGAVFKLTPQSGGGWTESTLYSFQGNADEQSPTAGLIFDSTGDLYGTTSGGFPPSGGTVFELSPSSGGGWTENALYTFQGTLLNGWTSNAGLIFDHSGNLYGTTSYGGSSADPNGCIGNGTLGNPYGCGTVFESSPSSGGSWTERVLYNFQGNADGAYPGAALISDQSGNLYSTGESGGDLSACNQLGCGVVFELSPIPSGTAATTTSLSLAPLSATLGSAGPIVMTATVVPTSGSGAPTGTAAFFNGPTQKGTGTLNGGVATFNYDPSGLAAGAYSITATYSGDNTFAGSTSSAQTLTVTKPTYSMSATAVTVSPGASGSSTVTVSSTGGYAGTVTLACAVTLSPNGATDLPTCSSTQTVTLSSNTTSATATVTVNTTAASSSALTWPQVGKGWKWAGAGGGAAMAVLIILWMPRRRRNWQWLLGVLVLMTAFGAAAGCGGGGGGTTPPPSNPGTTAGTYTITLTGTGNDSAKTTATTTFTLTVN